MAKRRTHWLGLAAIPLVAACAEGETPSVPLGLQVTPLTGTACGDPDAPTPGPDPFSQISKVTVAVRGVDADTGIFGTLARKTSSVRAGSAIKLGSIQEGADREVVVFAKGSGQSWFGRDTGLDVSRNTDTQAAMVLSRYDGFSCTPTPEGIQNAVFPAAVTMGDGRVLVAGGFTTVIDDGGQTKLAGATNAAFVFDPRTGATTSIAGGLGVGENRGAATMVYLPTVDKVLVLGGATELGLDASKAFPFSLDVGKALDDYLLFDPKTNTFAAGTERMSSKRAFARAASLADGTVLVTGGGAWPNDADDSHLECDIFDPQDNDTAGGFLDIPTLRGFYPRAGHSLTFLKNTPEGLTQLLIWGGTTPERSLRHPAEIYKQSGRQQDNINGTFSEVLLVGDPSQPPDFTYFHEVTRLSGQRFLATGGAPFESDAIQAPKDDEAWLLTYDDSVTPTLVVQKVAGFGPGRVFHTALSDDLRHVAVIGGFGGLDAIAAPNHVMSFDADAAASGAPFWSTADAAGALTTPRGGHAATLTPAGTVFVVGGEVAVRTGNEAKRMAAEIYTPSFVSLP